MGCGLGSPVESDVQKNLKTIRHGGLSYSLRHAKFNLKSKPPQNCHFLPADYLGLIDFSARLKSLENSVQTALSPKEHREVSASLCQGFLLGWLFPLFPGRVGQRGKCQCQMLLLGNP